MWLNVLNAMLAGECVVLENLFQLIWQTEKQTYAKTYNYIPSNYSVYLFANKM